VTNCLASRHPRLARQWDPVRNGKLTPRDIRPGSNRKVWWRCGRDAHHTWRSTISNRRAGNDCPYCSNQRVFPGRSLADLFPQVASLWHPTRNRGITPRDVCPGSGKRVWWRCPKGRDHEWPGVVRARARGRGCPFCANRLVSITNCLATRFPAIARTWHPSRNEPITPRDVVAGTGRRYWWKCAAGHEWRASVSNRTRLGVGCGLCARRRARVATTRKIRLRVHLPSDDARDG
jgi:hypothetical protein